MSLSLCSQASGKMVVGKQEENLEFCTSLVTNYYFLRHQAKWPLGTAVIEKGVCLQIPGQL